MPEIDEIVSRTAELYHKLDERARAAHYAQVEVTDNLLHPINAVLIDNPSNPFASILKIRMSINGTEKTVVVNLDRSVMNYRDISGFDELTEICRKALCESFADIFASLAVSEIAKNRRRSK
jgi:hypothetical protein